MKNLTLRQAAELWYDQSIDAIRTIVIEALMDYDPENWHEITVHVMGIFPETIQQFEKDGYVSLSESENLKPNTTRWCCIPSFANAIRTSAYSTRIFSSVTKETTGKTTSRVSNATRHSRMCTTATTLGFRNSVSSALSWESAQVLCERGKR